MTVESVSRLRLGALAAAVIVGLVGCGGSSSSSSSNSPGSSSSGSPSKAAASSPAVAQAVAVTKQFTDRPSDFPVSTPLPKRLPAGTTLGYLQCASSVCAQQVAELKPAAKALGASLITVPGGASAQQLQSAMTSLIQRKPSAILIPSIEPDLISTQVQQARAAGIPIVAGFVNLRKYGLTAGIVGGPQAVRTGNVLADWVAAHEPQGSHVAYYTTKDLTFEAPQELAFAAELKRVCPTCTLRVTDLPITSYGTTAPSMVVSDLQSNPNTTVAVFGANEPSTGVPAAMRDAGIKIPYIGSAPTPANFEDIKSHHQAAGLALDFPVLTWQMVDEASRLILHTPLTPIEKQGLSPIQWLGPNDVPASAFTPQGWTGYPNYQQMFEKLWGLS